MLFDQSGHLVFPLGRKIHQHQQGSLVDVILVFLYFDILYRHTNQGAGPDPKQGPENGQGEHRGGNAKGLIHRQEN